MKTLHAHLAAFVVLAGFTVAGATNGYFEHGYGATSQALAGAGTALPQSPLSTAVNPAAGAFLGTGYEAGVELFMPSVNYTVTGNPTGAPGTFGLTPGTVESNADFFVIPTAGANWAIGETSALSLVLFGNGGMATDYPTTTFYAQNPPTGVNLAQAFLDASYSRKIAKNHAVGFSLILASQWFSADGLEAFGGFSADASKLTNNGTSYSFGYGARVGYVGKITDIVSLGASAQSKLYMSEFDDYAGLFAEKGGFDVPATWNVGIGISPIGNLTFLFDVQQILYSDVKSVGTPFNPLSFQQGVKLGDANGPGFGWNDMTVYKIGVEWEQSARLTLRGGYSIGDEPIPSSDVLFNILAPGVIRQHIAFGGAWKLTGNKQVSIAVSRAFSNSVSGPNPMEAPNQQDIRLTMSQWDIEIGFAFK